MPNIKSPFSKYITNHDKEYALQEIFIHIFNYFCTATHSSRKVNLEHVGLALLRVADNLVEKYSSFEEDFVFIPIERRINYCAHLIQYIERRIKLSETGEEDIHLNKLYDKFQASIKSNTEDEVERAVESELPRNVDEYQKNIEIVLEDLVLEGRDTQSLYKALIEAAFLCIRIECDKDYIRYLAIATVHLEHIKELLNITMQTKDELSELFDKSEENSKLLGNQYAQESTSRH